MYRRKVLLANRHESVFKGNQGTWGSVSASEGGQMSWHVLNDLAGRGQQGLHVQGRRKEWADGGEEYRRVWLFLSEPYCTWAQDAAFSDQCQLSEPGSGCISTTGYLCQRCRRPWAHPLLFKFSATQSRSCSLWYIFHSFIHFIQRPWSWGMTFQVIVFAILWISMGACSSPRIEFVFYLVVQWQGEKTCGLWGHTDPGLSPGLPLTDCGQTTQPLWISFPHLKNFLICKMRGSHSTGFVRFSRGHQVTYLTHSKKCNKWQLKWNKGWGVKQRAHVVTTLWWTWNCPDEI